ncbi:lasso peptide biosynthesis PqqD family chaperone [Paenibacillus sp. LMG 31456]|uniref:Lasso peptide biosynthesis PqqD family chaperone n=1 Tax=Paenibacillus foliorum TaxID=2654974 RepID=A0A972JZV7_9BACL|nr:lasso peptide biosynthesis PqqD family chaperone [Paenibacillus foliorum]NOU92243.1 lasso peptide biosynthesis PqqD family chaperone [Paenibacillus foliorum]
MIGNKLSLVQVVMQNEGNIISNMDGNTVMLNIKNGKYYNLGKTGGVIWGAIKNPASIEEVILTLLSNYHIEKNECERQVISFLEQLYAEDLILLCS